MFEKLKQAANTAAESVTSVASNAASAVTSAASSAANAATEVTRKQYQAQIDNVIALMELTALRAKHRQSVKDFEVSASLNLGIASIQLAVTFDTSKIASEEVIVLENPATEVEK